MNLSEKTLSSNTKFSGRIITVKVDDVELSDGSKSKREIVEHNGGATVLAVFEGKIPLVKQFRYAYQKEIWELPAGKLEKGEDCKVCAKRELVEEVGLWPEEMVLLNTVYPSPGYTNEIIYIFLAENTCKVEQSLDEGEFLEVKYFTIDELKAMCNNGEICDGKTLIAIYNYLQILNGRN